MIQSIVITLLMLGNASMYSNNSQNKKVFVARLKSGNVLVEYEESGKVFYKIEKQGVDK